MPSPFPGMDPFIEPSGLWGDFHTIMLGEMREELNLSLPEGYVASVEVYVWTTEPTKARRRKAVGPDVYVREEKRRSSPAASAAAVMAPKTIVLPAIERRKRKALKVTDVHSKQVVTVIELLSPANKKAGADRETYLAKRDEYLANRINLVEIDLLRSGRRSPLGTPPPAIKDYCVMVCRPWEFPRAGFWTFGIRDPLPEIPVPLTEDEPETTLPLRRCTNRAYDKGRYAIALPYDKPLRPRPSKEDAAWAREILTARP